MLLSAQGLGVQFGATTAVHDVSFDIAPGETLALVGESGSGKSVTSLAVMGLLPPCRLAGRILFQGRDLLTLPDVAMRRIRGRAISMIFQEPMTSLNPVQRIGAQIAESIQFHQGVSTRAALTAAEALLNDVEVADAHQRLRAYPHEMSGGMRQRVMIAMALACHPSLLIADEPTTALDATIQAQILDLLRRVQRKTGMAMIFITHNLGVVAEIANRVAVMYAGRVVEQAPVTDIFAAPLMPYTQGLLRSIPRLDSLDAGRAALETIRGAPPDPQHMPPGCVFHPRCGFHVPGVCDVTAPVLEEAELGHDVRCLRWQDGEGPFSVHVPTDLNGSTETVARSTPDPQKDSHSFAAWRLRISKAPPLTGSRGGVP
jgi:oligopeptide transport system ATP-binding protein